MIKKFLSATLFGFLMLGLAGTFVACDDYDDSDLRRRVDAVEGTLADLKAQIANGVLIESITSSSNGVTITTSDGNTYNITNGTNGVDGTPGSVVEIGDNGNWFIDGVDTGMPSRGAAGQDGADGQDGKDGYVPSIEIRDGYWYIDGQNTGQAAQGPQGEQGPQGPQGEQGEQGPAGPQGPAGADGQDGNDGADGADGTVITISEDGYWVIDGVKTDVIARGQNGQDGQDGADGEDGKDGQDGQDGEDGKDADIIYYVPDPEGYWAKVIISAESGETTYEPIKDGSVPMWKPVGTITAVLNTDTQILTLYNVKDNETGEATTVTIKLSEPLVGITFVPDVMSNGMGVVYKYRLYFNEDKDVSATWEDEDLLVASNELNLVYRLNPSNADLSGIEAWEFVNRQVETRAAKGDGYNLLTWVRNEIDNINYPGVITAVATVNELPGEEEYDASKEDLIFALQATGENNRVITSDYAKLEAYDMKKYAIYTTEGEEAVTTKTAEAYPTEEPKVITDATATQVNLVRGTTVDLNDCVQTIATNLLPEMVAVDETGFDITYKFSETEVKDGTGTVQNSFVDLDENGVVSVSAGASALGRKPVFKVEAEVNGTVIATAYIVMQIVSSSINDITVTAEPIKLIYSQIDVYDDDIDDTFVPFEWEQINKEIYDALDMSAAQFAAAYENKPEIIGTADAAAGTEEQVPGVFANLSGSFPTDQVSTADFLTIDFNTQIPISRGSEYKNYGKVTLTYKPKVANAYPAVILVIPYTVTDNCDEQQLSFSDYITGTEWDIYGDGGNGDYTFGATLKKAFAEGSKPMRNHTYTFKFAGTTETTVAQAEITNVSDWEQAAIAFDGQINGVTADNKPVTTSYAIEMVSTRDNGEPCDVTYNFTINFCNPLELTFDKLETTFANNTFPEVDVKSGINIEDARGRIGKLVDSGALDDDNAWGIEESEITYTYELLGDWGGALDLSKDGKLSYTGTGFGYKLPATVKVRVTASVAGISVTTADASITIKPAE